MNNFNRDNRDGFRRKRSDGRRFDRPGKGQSDMFPATCDKCGKSCEVPFRPTSGKPIYCSNCFEGKEGRSGDRFERRGFGRRDFGRRDFGSRRGERTQMHSAVCDECGNKCEVPFRPTEGKPIFCSDCFEKKGMGKNHFGKPQGTENFTKLKEQLDIMNNKLDQIMSILKPEVAKEPVSEKSTSDKLKKAKKINPKKLLKKSSAKDKKGSSDVIKEI